MICAGAGNDQINGLGGNDTIYAGPGGDIVDGGPGSDVAYGGGGNDTISGGDGQDIAHGGDGQDIAHGGDGSDTLNGGADTDRLVGDDGEDSLRSEHGHDVLIGGTGNDMLDGGAGIDHLFGEDGNDHEPTATSGPDVCLTVEQTAGCVPPTPIAPPAPPAVFDVTAPVPGVTLRVDSTGGLTPAQFVVTAETHVNPALIAASTGPAVDIEVVGDATAIRTATLRLPVNPGVLLDRTGVFYRDQFGAWEPRHRRSHPAHGRPRIPSYDQPLLRVGHVQDPPRGVADTPTPPTRRSPHDPLRHTRVGVASRRVRDR